MTTMPNTPTPPRDVLEQIVAEMRKLAVRGDSGYAIDAGEVDELADRIERALPSLAELERDAARYGLLRNEPTSHLYVRHNDNGQIEVATGTTLDALVDARMKP